MKHISFSFDDTQEYKKALKKSTQKAYKSILIQVFASTTDEKKLKAIIKKLSDDFSNALIIGTTTAGEISNAKMYEDSTIISLSLFDDTKLKASYVKDINIKSGHAISQSIFSKHTKAVIVLSEGLHGEDYEGFIKGIKQENPDILLAGGLAGDNFKLEKTLIIYKNKILKEGAVAVSLSAKTLFADNRYNLNWTPIGKKFTVTSSQGSLVHEIDGKDALTVFKHYLGENILSNNAASLPNFPLLYSIGNTIVSRTPLGIQGTSIVFAGPIKESQEVQFGFSNASSVISGSNKISTQISKNPAEAIYIYSCIARKTLLGESLEQEFSNFNAIAPTSGFFTYGEFYSSHKSNVLLNCSTTLLILSENTKKSKSRFTRNDTDTQNIENATFLALTHFIKQTSLELQENLELLNQYKTAVDLSSLVSKTDPQGVITYVNDNFCKTSGYAQKELLGKKHNIIRNKQMSQSIFKNMWQSITNSKVWKGVLSNRAKDGSIYYVNSTVIPILDFNAKIVEYIAIHQDITKEIISSQHIKKKEKLIKAMFDNQDSIVIYTSKEEGMLNVNKKLFDYLDYSSFELFKADYFCICELFLHEDGYTNPVKYPNWLDEIANQTGINKAKLTVKDGTVHTFKIIIKKLEYEYVLNMYDITELEQAIQKANASEHAKSMFLANMSHEIRTPLNGILGFTDILSKKNLDKEIKNYIDIMKKSGQTLLNIVNDILDYSKIESGKLVLFLDEANLFEEIETTVITFSFLSKKKQIEYYTYIDTNIPKLLTCDVQRIKQVLNNLISNAIKFTPNNGSVYVNITLLNIKDNVASIKFSIKDTGVGIAKDKLELIFKSFSQADSSISREFGGTGLGLSISSQFIEMMDSKLELYSQEGEGSEFFFTLELPVLNRENSVSALIDTNKPLIQLYAPKDEEHFGINQVVATYLNTWNYNFSKIYNTKEVHENTDILIISARDFQKLPYQELFIRFEKLQIIYIEGGPDSFNCEHPRFHYLDQPMTGSALFNTILALTDVEPHPNQTLQELDTNQFNGNILIAEDNETNQMLISLLLEEKGLNHTVVNNGQAAVDEALLHNYDIIFMDINMPVMDGITATKILREKNYNRTIVSLSANVIDSDIQIIKNAGVNETLNKPIMIEELDEVLDKYLKKNLDFDTINPKSIAKSLSIDNLEIIKKLLGSFRLTAETMLEKIETDGLNKELFHNIKGVAGNLRFNKLYALSKKLENEFDILDKKALQTNKELLNSHLKNLLEQISLIYK